MDIEEVQRRVEEIRAASDDSERAHALEDTLYRDVLRSIAHDPTIAAGPSVLAAVAIEAASVEFDRWYA